MSSITLIGPGAVGLTVAAALIDNGHEVAFVSRQPFATLIVDDRDGLFRLHPAQLSNPPAVTDWVLICTKAHQTASAAEAIRQATGPETCIAVLQNGVEHADRLAPFVTDTTPVVPVVVDIPGVKIASGHVAWRGRATLAVQDNEPGRAFTALFESSFIMASTTPDLTTKMWRKLCVNAPAGAVLALTRQPMGVFHRAGVADIARALLAECIAVGRAEGAQLPDSVLDEQMAGYMSASPSDSNSMLEDVRAGRESEWDARNAVLVRKGLKHGIPTPVSAALVPLLAALVG